MATLAPTSKAAFIGLGNIGKVLAARVANAPELTALSVYDLNPAPGQELESGKVTSAADVAEAAAGAEVILTCLPRSSNVKVRPCPWPLPPAACSPPFPSTRPPPRSPRPSPSRTPSHPLKRTPPPGTSPSRASPTS